jgi:hypothetical protein
MTVYELTDTGVTSHDVSAHEVPDVVIDIHDRGNTGCLITGVSPFFESYDERGI